MEDTIKKELLDYLVKLGFDVFSLKGESGIFIRVDYSKELKKQKDKQKQVFFLGGLGQDMYDEIVKSVLKFYPRSEVSNATGNVSVTLLLKE